LFLFEQNVLHTPIVLNIRRARLTCPNKTYINNSYITSNFTRKTINENRKNSRNLKEKQLSNLNSKSVYWQSVANEGFTASFERLWVIEGWGLGACDEECFDSESNHTSDVT
jgi:hypothetical protein